MGSRRSVIGKWCGKKRKQPLKERHDMDGWTVHMGTRRSRIK
jgi:hypothetical protein